MIPVWNGDGNCGGGGGAEGRVKAIMADEKSFGEKLRHLPVGIMDYIRELQMEMRRVTWPSRKQVQATTAVVIVTVFMFAAYFAVVDNVFSKLIDKLFQTLAGTPS